MSATNLNNTYDAPTTGRKKVKPNPAQAIKDNKKITTTTAKEKQTTTSKLPSTAKTKSSTKQQDNTVSSNAAPKGSEQSNQNNTQQQPKIQQQQQYNIEMDSDFESDEDEYMILDIYDQDLLQNNNVLDGMLIKDIYLALEHQQQQQTKIKNQQTPCECVIDPYVVRCKHCLQLNIRGAGYRMTSVPIDSSTMYIYGYSDESQKTIATPQQPQHMTLASTNKQDITMNNTTNDETRETDQGTDNNTQREIIPIGIVKHHFVVGKPPG